MSDYVDFFFWVRYVDLIQKLSKVFCLKENVPGDFWIAFVSAYTCFSNCFCSRVFTSLYHFVNSLLAGFSWL